MSAPKKKEWCMRCRTRHLTTTPHDAELGGIVRSDPTLRDRAGARERIMEVVDAEMAHLSKSDRQSLRLSLISTLDAERGE